MILLGSLVKVEPYYSIDLFEKEQYQYKVWQMQQSSMQQSTFICSKELLRQTQHESDCFSSVLSFAAGPVWPAAKLWS